MWALKSRISVKSRWISLSKTQCRQEIRECALTFFSVLGKEKETAFSQVPVLSLSNSFWWISGMGEYGRQNNDSPLSPTKSIHILIPKTCDMLLPGKGKLMVVDGIKVANWWILKWGDYPGGPNAVTKIWKWQRGAENEHRWWDWEDPNPPGQALKPEEGDHGPSKMSGLYKLEKVRRQIFAWTLQKGVQT